MTTPPEGSSSLGSRGVALLLSVAVVVGGGMYFLGRHSHSSPQGTAQTAPGAPASSPKSGERHLAPRGTFYLLQYVSVKQPDGVYGFDPGQEVRLVDVHRDTQTLVVTDGKTPVEVGPDKLTNDMDIATMVRQNDQANQAKIAAYVQSEQKAYADSQRAAAIKTEQALDKIDQRKQQEAAVAANNAKANASPASGDHSPLDDPPVEVGGGTGYGYEGSAYYGSPYSYFNGSTATTTAPVTTGGGGTTAHAGSASAGHR